MNLSANDKYTKEISRTEYDELIEGDLMLRALYICGVENWKGYDLALEYYVKLKKMYDKNNNKK